VTTSLERLLLVLALVALSACGSDPRPDASPVSDRSTIPIELVSQTPEWPDPTQGSATADRGCVDAFDGLAGEMARLPDFDAAGSTLDSTLEACATLDAWLDAAEGFFTAIEVRRSDAEAFIRERCSAMPELDGALC
jgi:hypothetical protein